MLTVNVTDIGDNVYEKRGPENRNQVINFYCKEFIRNLKYLRLKPHTLDIQRASWNMKPIKRAIKNIISSPEWTINCIKGLRAIKNSNIPPTFGGFNEKEDYFNKDASFKDFCIWREHPSYNYYTFKMPGYVGEGIPSWHAQCAAIICKNHKSEIIHYGSTDLRCIHHANESDMLQTLRKDMSIDWYYVEPLILQKGQKMSKSCNNTVRCSLKDYATGEKLCSHVAAFSPRRKTVFNPLQFKRDMTEFMNIKKLRGLKEGKKSFLMRAHLKNKGAFNLADTHRKDLLQNGYVVMDYWKQTLLFFKKDLSPFLN